MIYLETDCIFASDPNITSESFLPPRKYRYIGREFEPVLKSIEAWGYRYIDYLEEKNAGSNMIGG